jgi:hypothetical protein
MPRANSAVDHDTITNNCPTRIGGKRQPFGLYPADVPRLFVTSPDMNALHEASRPEAVARRAVLSKRIFEHWSYVYAKKAPWLPDWLYGGDRPEGDFSPTDAMHAFRAGTEVVAVMAATERRLDEVWVGSHPRRSAQVNRSDVQRIRRLFRTKYPRQGWLEGWLLRGRPAPPEVRVATLEEVRRCAAAWDYVGLCRRAGIGSHVCNYYPWFTRPPTVIPNGPERLAWLKWLYGSEGYRRAPAFVVTPELQVYRRRGSVAATAKAANVSLPTMKRWKNDPALWKLLREAVRAARHGKEPDSDDFQALDPRTKECMRRYARASTTAARCKDAGIAHRELNRLLREADARGVKPDLLDYLNNRGPYRSANFATQCGLVHGKLFILTPAMRAFHEEAVKEWVEQKITELERLPGFDEWFVAWVTPALEKPRGQVPTGDGSGDARETRGGTGNQQAKPDGAAIKPAAARGGRQPENSEAEGRQGRRSTSGPLSHGTREIPPRDRFVPTPFQMRILGALKHKFRTADQLQERLYYDRGGRGLQELKKEGLVANDRSQGRGYYRPDAPPPEIAGFLGK